MRRLSDLHKRDKRGISVVVGYALLIGMTIALSVLVFQWLRHYVSDTGENELSCPEGVSVIISEADCAGGRLNITLKNKGRHNVDGFIIRVTNRIDATQGVDSLDPDGVPITVGESVPRDYNLSTVGLNNITLIEVQSSKTIDNKTLYCPFIDIINIECTL